jgi:Xaa-Pro aminopeptidase
MSPEDPLRTEIANRVGRVQEAMKAQGFDALVVYGNTKAGGSVRYLSDYYVDRTGWVSLGPTGDDSFIFDAAGVVVPATGDPVLLIEPGHMVSVIPAIDDFRGGGLTGGSSQGLTPIGVCNLLRELGATGRVGLETWHRFPAPLYLGLKDELPRTEFARSSVVETVRLIKSPYEIEILHEAGRVGDAAHAEFVKALGGVPTTELDLVRVADQAMRTRDPIYEDCLPASTSLICSGSDVLGMLLHTPLQGKVVERGDIVNWDVCGRYRGYAIDTSRTRVAGKATRDQEVAYAVVLEMSRAVRQAACPGALTTDLVRLADQIGKDGGFGLWAMFLGHGLGLDTHERPDMGVEEMVLAENMVITVEPRIVFEDRWLMANEDMVLVTPEGGKTFGTFPREPLGID